MNHHEETKKRSVSIEEVARIAELSRLNPSVGEKERLAQEMSHILGHVEQLKELDTENIEPLHHVLDLHNVLRADEPSDSFSAETTLKNAPARKGDYFLVPKVIKDAE